MNKLLVDTIIQYGGEKLSDKDSVLLLNIISKNINKKIKILEYKHIIKIKLKPLKEDNWDCLPKKIGFETIVDLKGPLKGQIPFYTNVELSLPPVVAPVISPIISPIGAPVYGVVGLNPLGNNTLQSRNEIALQYLEILKKISTELEQLKKGLIEKKDVDTKYFDFVDIDITEPFDTIGDLEELVGRSGKSFYSNL